MITDMGQSEAGGWQNSFSWPNEHTYRREIGNVRQAALIAGRHVVIVFTRGRQVSSLLLLNDGIGYIAMLVSKQTVGLHRDPKKPRPSGPLLFLQFMISGFY